MAICYWRIECHEDQHGNHAGCDRCHEPVLPDCSSAMNSDAATLRMIRRCLLWQVLASVSLTQVAAAIVYRHLSTPEAIPHVFFWDYQGLRLEGEFPQT